MNILIIKQTGEGVNPPRAGPASCALHPCSKRKPKLCPHKAGGADLGARHTQQCLQTPERPEEVTPRVRVSACQGRCSVWYIVLDNHLLLKLAWESDKNPSGKGNPVGQVLRERNSWLAFYLPSERILLSHSSLAFSVSGLKLEDAHPQQGSLPKQQDDHWSPETAQQP